MYQDTSHKCIKTHLHTKYIFNILSAYNIGIGSKGTLNVYNNHLSWTTSYF